MGKYEEVHRYFVFLLRGFPLLCFISVLEVERYLLSVNGLCLLFCSTRWSIFSSTFSLNFSFSPSQSLHSIYPLRHTTKFKAPLLALSNYTVHYGYHPFR